MSRGPRFPCRDKAEYASGHLSISLGGVGHSREPSAKQAIVVIQRGIRLVRVAFENICAYALACLAR